MASIGVVGYPGSVDARGSLWASDLAASTRSRRWSNCVFLIHTNNKDDKINENNKYLFYY